MDIGVNESGGSLPVFHPSYGSVTGASPIKVQKDAPFKELDKLPEDKRFIRNRVWVPFSSSDAPIVILVIEQPMTVWSSMFYGEAAPEGYSALPDA